MALTTKKQIRTAASGKKVTTPAPRGKKTTANVASTPQKAKATAGKKAVADTLSAEGVKQARRQRWNPLRHLTPETLTRALDAFDAGDLREFALLAEVIADRDDTLKSVKPKREKAIASRDWKILKREKSKAAEEHAEILKGFWTNVRAENAYDRNEKGGLGRLIKQMMSAVSVRYAAHHIVWKPEPGRLRAVFEFVPLWFFENREGRLRFLPDGFGVEGVELDEREWMITCGDGLMVACAINYLGKKFCTQDWLTFSEKFSQPGILGLTPAGKGTPEGDAMKGAVASFSQDFAAVIYGADGSQKDPIRLIQPNGNPSAMPMPAYIERADRKMAGLYRGADLSSMSSKDGEGTGASLQGDEAMILESDDCMTISETLQQVEREVIRWHFGEGVEPLAYIEIQPPVQIDKKFILEALNVLVGHGVRLPARETLEQLGLSEAELDELAIGEQAAPAPEANSGAGWVKFARETGTLGIPRDIMPQIKSSNRAAMVNLLRANGIDYVKAMAKPSDLKPTQAEYSTEKLERAKTYQGTPRAILISADNHIVDGHHQYLSALHDEPNRPIEVFRIKAPIMQVLGLVLKMASTTAEKTSEANAAGKLYKNFKEFVRAARPGETWMSDDVDALRAALNSDFQPLGEALADALQQRDFAAMKAALKKISAGMPGLPATPQFQALFADQLTTAYLADP